MFSSKYNHFVKLSDTQSALFNTFSGCVIKLDNELVRKLSHDVSLLSSEERNSLYKLGVLVDNIEEQEKVLKFKRSRGIYSSDTATFRILVTTCCNARCFYCYEEGIKTSSMTMGTASKLIEFIKSKAINTNKIKIQWFGGEPTLNPEVMYYITSELKDYCNQCNKEINFSMITNGSLLHKISIEKLYLSRVQISLDGLHKEYSERKSYLDNNVSLNLILHNISILIDKGVYVSIRLNYDTNNYNSIVELLAYLSSYFADKKRVRVYPYPLFGTYCNHKSPCNITTKNQLLELYRLISDYGFNNELDFQKLRLRSNRCFACNYNSFVINADGKLYKCTACMNESVGDVFDGVKLNSEFLKWVNSRISTKCSDCSFLPLCQGGCMAGQLTDHPVTCFIMKDVIDDIVSDYVCK